MLAPKLRRYCCKDVLVRCTLLPVLSKVCKHCLLLLSDACFVAFLLMHAAAAGKPASEGRKQWMR